MSNPYKNSYGFKLKLYWVILVIKQFKKQNIPFKLINWLIKFGDFGIVKKVSM